MRRFGSLLLLLVFPALFVAALPKVAVLNALVNDKIDPSVVTPVTDKVVEKLVASSSFVVLDREYVDQVLKEREFQLSGMVTDQDISKAGKYLGAQYVVVIRVELVGDTYFVSSRMIDVETGVIYRQASAQGEGKLAVLLSLADQVGSTIAGLKVAPPATAQGRAQTLVRPSTDQDTTANTPPPPQTAPAPARATTSNKALENIGFRLYVGVGNGTQAVGSSTKDIQAGDIYFIIPLDGPLCMTANFTYIDGSSSNALTSYGFDMGIGLALPIANFIMPWGSAKLGFSTLSASDYSGFEAAVDLGVDLKLGSFLMGVRYQVQSASLSDYTGKTIDTVTDATIVMVGIKF